MKAVVFHEHGAPDVLRYEDVPEPSPGPGEVLIEVHATSINHIDIFLRRGMPGIKVPLPKIAGSDASGIIRELGPDVSGLKTGQRVTINRMDLLGSPVSLGGKGQMNLDGSDMNLEFYAVWARVMQVLPPIINEIPQAISKQFLKIKLRGDLGVKVQTVKEPVPILVDPLKELLDVMGGRKMRNAKSEIRNSGEQ